MLNNLSVKNPTFSTSQVNIRGRLLKTIDLFYALGVSEPDFHVTIDIVTKKVTLYSPELNPEHVMWMGLPDSLETLQSKYDVDEVVYVTELKDRLASSSIVYTLPITQLELKNTCSAEQSKKLHQAFAEARAIKAEWEVELIRKANTISSNAHAMVKKYIYKKKSSFLLSNLYYLVDERS